MKRIAIILSLVLFPLLARADVASFLHDYLARMEAFGFSGSVAVTRKGQTVFERAYEKGSLWMQNIWFPRRLDGVRVRA